MLEDLEEKVGIGNHESTRMAKDEWLTPPSIVEALGPFDLDPCSPIDRPWPTAREHYTIDHDGLLRTWKGRVWMNPPYGGAIGTWMGRLAEHGDGIALTFARTDTAWFHEYVWQRATGLFFFKGRLFFHHVDGSQAETGAGAPSVAIAYGDECAKILKEADLGPGAFVSVEGDRIAIDSLRQGVLGL